MIADRLQFYVESACRSYCSVTGGNLQLVTRPHFWKGCTLVKRRTEKNLTERSVISQPIPLHKGGGGQELAPSEIVITLKAIMLK